MALELIRDGSQHFNPVEGRDALLQLLDSIIQYLPCAAFDLCLHLR